MKGISTLLVYSKHCIFYIRSTFRKCSSGDSRKANNRALRVNPQPKPTFVGKSQEFTRGHYESTSERGAYWILRWWTSDIDKHFVPSNADKAFSKNVFYIRGCTVWASYTPFFSLIKDLTCLLLASIQHSKLHWTFTRRQPENNAFPETLTKLKTVLDILFSTFLNVKVIQWLLFSDIFIIREKKSFTQRERFFLPDVCQLRSRFEAFLKTIKGSSG